MSINLSEGNTSNEISGLNRSVVNKNESFQPIQFNNRKTYLATKRVIDLLCSFFALIVLSPVFLITYIAIKVEDRHSPAFFNQIRMGKDGKQFTIYKYRSMVLDAEDLKVHLLHQNDVTGPVFKMKNDPRVTKVGRFIRKTSIDELPQLLNVLKGEMSLVGPRPPLPEEVEQYTNYEKQRLRVQPGLTCYWQISGRNNLSFDEWVKLDLDYIQHRNLWIDIKLIVKTIFVFFGTKDAY